MPQKWDDNLIQFARLISEISANVEMNGNEFADVRNSMDLTMFELNDLFARAQQVWEQAKRGRELRFDTEKASELRIGGDVVTDPENPES